MLEKSKADKRRPRGEGEAAAGAGVMRQRKGRDTKTREIRAYDRRAGRRNGPKEGLQCLVHMYRRRRW